LNRALIFISVIRMYVLDIF